MGFIKAIGDAASQQAADMYREVIKYENNDKSVLVKKITTESGVISNESRLFVEPGQCAVYTDNGAIKDIVSEPGMYFMDTTAPSLFQTNIFGGLAETIKEAAKRVAYEGEAINQQAVYFISLAEVTDLMFKTVDNILYKDPTWGPMEIGVTGSYGIKVVNPVYILNNLSSNAGSYTVENIRVTLFNYINATLMESINKLEVEFDSIPANVNNVADGIVETINKKMEELGIEITRVIINSVSVPEEIKNAMKERTAIKMKATSVDDAQADVYTKLNTAEAIKDLANNSNNSGTSIMGMNLGNTVAGVINKTVDGNEEK